MPMVRSTRRSYIRLNALASTPLRPVSDYRNLLLQKWPAPEFECVTKMCVNGLENGDYAGIVSLGVEYGAVGIVKNFGEYAIRTVRALRALIVRRHILRKMLRTIL